MFSVPVVSLVALVLTVIVAAGWRLLSRRRLLPCPSSFAWVLENPVIERVAGSQALMDRAGVCSGMNVLDAGCGPGRVTIPLARRVGPGGRVVALDAQASMLSKLQRRLEEQDVTNVRLVHAELGTGALASEQFDRAFLVTVLGEIPNQEQALREIHGLLAPGGILSVSEVLPDPHYQRRSKVRALALLTGYDPTLVHHTYRSYTMNLRRGEHDKSPSADRVQR